MNLRWNEKGLTLIELCLTLLILGLIIALATPRLAGSYHSMHLKSVAQKIAEEVCQIQNQAELLEQEWKMKIVEDGRGYLLEKEETSINDLNLDQKKWEVVFQKKLPEDFSLECSIEEIAIFPYDGQPIQLGVKDGKNRMITIQIENGQYELFSQKHIKK
ncbi:MAG: hypothetical protein D6748_06085 [Calditrichaeota bacterium]|nr:MAG: hypothetical protein D6748_06085 [Calditrichota bacterium]